MKLYQVNDYQEMSRKAANIISAKIILKPQCVIGLATGSTPIGIYKQLIEWYKKGDLDFSEVKSINLDEYKGLDENHKQSYHYFMNKNFFYHVNFKKENTNLPNGMADNIDAECDRYNQVITNLGEIDLQLLGLGHNGHIGFNEPGEEYKNGTHCVALSESTIEANSRLFEEGEVIPKYAFTMGIRSILKAKKILLVVSGKDKADILNQVLNGPVTPKVPASILQFHNDVTVVADKGACSKINEDTLISLRQEMI
ncbi:glucosamine-6-phosphate deaminase [Mobilisporobacter senegalensis]|uniref:Glucosamine-6-phosphate deaminase n=1 Tax=Mobilisporobacter senegalensis TaxID=1329262 RepID=A0A3N1XL05_9FIRM|nr:glucosamine-6-phosphate deaminase [Mobilisporobacter senegalensis]ROR27394.1 glucosamine-6-phosphate deaminase [Mobilisporobacter senegalensis]